MNKESAFCLAAAFTAYILGIVTGILFIRERVEKESRKREEKAVKSVKAAYEKKLASVKAEYETPETDFPLTSTVVPDEVYEKLLKEHRYAPEEKEDAVVILPDEFGDIRDYEIRTIIYYEKNGAFVDNNDKHSYLLEDEEWENMLGCGVVKHFGDYLNDPDTVYIRNDARRAYYEVVRDEGAYTE